MNTKKPWIIIGGVTLVIGAATTYLLFTSNRVSSPQDSSEANAPVKVEATATVPTEQEVVAPQPGKYEGYDAEVVAKDSGRKVLFFHAPWCPQCRALEQSIQAGTIPDGVTIYKVDFDTAHDLRTKYGVNLQTTLVEVGSGGTEIKKYVAYSSPTLEAVIKGLGLE